MGKKKSAKRETEHNDKPAGPPKPAPLLKDGQLTGPFKQCLVEIFGRFDVDNDKLLSEAELKAFSSSANRDGAEFSAEEFAEMKSLFEWLDGPNGSGMSLRGFVQMYTQQTHLSELESWSDLNRLGYDTSLKRREDGVCDDKLRDSQVKSEQISETLQKFSESSNGFVSFPTSPASRCQAIRQTARSLGFECRILQLDRSERLCVFKVPTLCAPETGLEDHVSSPGSETDKVGGGAVVFTALELDSKSCKLLQDVFADSIPSGWTIYAHHMTICLGSLADARSNGNPVSDDLESSIRQLKAKDPGTLKVVSIGKGKGVVALGVIGCPSVNRVPHITLACANGHKPVESNGISTWEKVSEFHILTGHIREFEQRDASAGLTASAKQVHEDLVIQLKHLEAEVLAARAIHLLKIQDSDEQTLRRAIEEREQELCALKSDDSGGWEVAQPKALKASKAAKGKSATNAFRSFFSIFPQVFKAKVAHCQLHLPLVGCTSTSRSHIENTGAGTARLEDYAIACSGTKDSVHQCAFLSEHGEEHVSVIFCPTFAAGHSSGAVDFESALCFFLSFSDSSDFVASGVPSVRQRHSSGLE